MGVYKRTYPSGEKAHYARVQHKGKVYLSRAFPLKWQAAEEWARMKEAKRHGELEDRYGTQTKECRRAFGDLVAEYRKARELEVESGERAASQWERERRIVKRLETEFGDLLLHDLDRGVIEGFKFNRRKEAKGATVNRALASLSSILRLGVDRGWLEENPAHGIRRYPEKPEWTWLRPEEADKLLGACQRPGTPPYLYPLVLFALYTGMRAGEITALRWVDVDLRGSTVALEKTKTGKRRMVPLRPEVVRVLNRWKGTHPGPYVIAKEDGTPFKQVPLCFETALRRAGLRQPDRWIRFHDLRHTAASWMAQGGADLLQIKRVLGHTTIVTTQRYAHLVRRNDEMAIQAMPSPDELAGADDAVAATAGETATKTATRAAPQAGHKRDQVQGTVTPLPRNRQ